MKRQKSLVGATTFILMTLILAGCPWSAGTGDTTTVQISVGEYESRSIVPDVESAIESYRVTLSRDSFDDLTVTGAEGPFSFSDVETGTWNILVEALNADEAVVAAGEASIDVTAGGANSATVGLSATQLGSGEAAITITWPSADLINSVLSATLTPDGGDDQSITASFTTGATQTTWTSSLQSGMYTLNVHLGLGAVHVATVIESLHIYDNVVAEATIALESGDISQAPAAPSNLVATAVDNTTVELSWLDNSHVEEGFELQRSDDEWSTFASIDLPAQTTGHIDGGLTEGTLYRYRVLAYNDFGISDPSNEATATPSAAGSAAIVADHTVVDLYDSIPEIWIAEVKKMLLSIPGESHGRGYVYGLELLEALDPRYAVSATWSGAPEGRTDQHLRITRTYRDGAFWSASGGEEDFWTNAAALAMMQGHLDYMQDTAANPVDAFGFGWCWDMTWHNSPGGGLDTDYGVHWAGSSEGGPDGDMRWGLDGGDTALTGNSVNLTDYLAAVEAYNENSPATVTFYTTGPVDGNHGNENGYQRYLKHQAIREHVTSTDGVLFDYADILSWDDGVQYMDSWDGHVFPNGDPDLATGGDGYDGGEGGSHISEEGCVRLAKAMWWMLARVAGWDGEI